MKYRIRHYTEYTYEEPVSTCFNRLCLTPLSVAHHQCIMNDINIVPTPDEISQRTDFFGNTITFISIYQEHKRLKINSTSVVNIENRVPAELAFSSAILWKDVRLLISAIGDMHEVIQYTLPSHHVPVSETIQKFSADCFPEDATLWSVCNTLMQKIYTTIEFKPGFTTVNTPVETVVKSRKGVCQDFAHLMIACLRNMGLPARYVSGYIETIPPPGKERLVGADASHAWVSVYFPSIGWVEFDPTNCLLPTYKHITVGFGRDYQDVAPIKGIVFSSGQQKLSVKVDVERIK
ncbi:MAG TPA: transglutaminase family protein [Ohtaekwangia sp.]|uniref:transglutaminase family protein n=1 Tax=Ohtaekwangia sp. TaxID=2066019 RepID=UPI002F956AA6